MADIGDRGKICSEVRELLASAREDALSSPALSSPALSSPTLSEKIKLHLEACDDCSRFGDQHGWELDLLDKASVPSPGRSDLEFLASTRRRIKHRSAWRLAGALAAAMLLAALGLTWFLPARDDQAVIENLAVLEDLQEVSMDLLPFLKEESRAAPSGEFDEDDAGDEVLIEYLLEETGKRG